MRTHLDSTTHKHITSDHHHLEDIWLCETQQAKLDDAAVNDLCSYSYFNRNNAHNAFTAIDLVCYFTRPHEWFCPFILINRQTQKQHYEIT